MPRKLGPETAKNFERRVREGFFETYLKGTAILDIGYRGSRADADPITDHAIGIDLDYPGYDGRRLPFPDESQDAVFASHVLEHIEDHSEALREWYRVLKVGGYLVIAVPHQDLYERKASPPSRFNQDHKRFYTPALLLTEIESALPVGGFRVRSLKDVDDGFDYSVPPNQHARGSYEIEVIVEKLSIPFYADDLRREVHSREINSYISMLEELECDEDGLKDRIQAIRANFFAECSHFFRQRNEVYQIGVILGEGVRDNVKVENLNAARLLLEKAIELEPGNAGNFSQLSTVLMRAGWAEEAAQMARRAIEIDPRQAGFYSILSHALSRLDKLDEAIAAIRQAILLSPDDVNFLAHLSSLLVRSGALDEAEAVLNQALERVPEDLQIRSRLGEVLAQRGDVDRAIDIARSVIRQDPSRPDLWNELSHRLTRAGRLGEAVAAVRKAIAIGPNSAHFSGHLGSLLMRLGELPEAERSLRDAIDLAPRNAHVHALLSQLLARQGRMGDAADAARHAVELAPDNAEFRNMLQTLASRPSQSAESR